MLKSKRALLKASRRLMPIVLFVGVLVNATWGQASAVELFYDDGEIDAYGVMAGGPENTFVYVVSFHSPWESSQLLEVKFYLRDHTTDFPSAPPNFPTYGYPCTVVVMDTNRARIFEQEVIPSSAGWVSVNLGPHSVCVLRDFYVGVEVTHSYQEGDIWVFVPFVGYDSDDPDGESWFVHVLPPSHPTMPGEQWTHEENYDFMIRAVVSPLELLQSALDRVGSLITRVIALYEEGGIDQYKFYHIGGVLNMTWVDIVNAMDFLDTVRHGFNDRVEGLYALKSAVNRLEYLIKDLRKWVNWGLMDSDLSDEIIQELEAINMAMTNKARCEARAERRLAGAAIEDAEARGRYVPWLWNTISYIENYLAEGDYWVAEGWLSKAVSYYKDAFYRSQRVAINAWHWSWNMEPEDWIDQLEDL